jgi:serine/threonine-protein kinase
MSNSPPPADLRAQLQSAVGSLYTIERELGGGGMSRVFLATETALDRPVVLKVLPPDLTHAVSADRFRQEIRLAARLQHPHIVPLHSAGEAAGLLHYTMPFVEGESLRTRLTRGGELAVKDAVRILRDVAAALDYAHAHGLIHRDIKPDNVLLSGGEALVTDFGVAKALSASATGGDSGLTSLGVALGTPTYMAPEQAAADPHVDHRADLYAWGCLAYECLTGQPPFAGRQPAALLAAHMAEAPEPVERRRPGLPASLAALVMRCLEKRPADRPQSAAEVLQVLEAAVTPTGGSAPTVPARAMPRRRSRLIVATAGGALAVIAGFALHLSGPERAGAKGLDTRVAAVLPFRVAGAESSLGYLREGMVDLLAAKLTGAGGLRAAEPRTVLSAWRRAGGAADRELAEHDALALSSELGAGRLIQGSLVGSQRRITLSASLLDVPRGDPLAQATVEGPEDSLPALIDRLAAQLLTATAVGTSLSPAGLSTSLPALQAYLDGAAAYRRGRYVDAGRALNRALDLDSTFAAAAFLLTQTAGWENVPGVERAGRVLVAHRDRLDPRARLLLQAASGPRYPRLSSGAEMIAAAESAVAAYPDQPDAWYYLGDWYFHVGDLIGLPHASSRSLAALERAMSLDPDFLGPREHVMNIHAERRDTAELLRLQRQIESDSSGGRRDFLLWRITAAIGDSAARARRRATLGSLAPREVLAALSQIHRDALDPEDADTLLAVQDRQASAGDSRLAAAYMRAVVGLLRGTPGVTVEAGAQAVANGADPGLMDPVGVFDALYADGDTAHAARAIRRLVPIAEAAPGAETAQRARQYGAICWVEQWRLAHGDTRTAARAVSRLRAAAEPADSFTTVGDAHLCAAMLDAWLGTVTERPDADRARLALDSIMRTAPSSWIPYPGAVPANQLLARLFAAVGDTARALAAVRRYQRDWGADVLRAKNLRLQGRLAAAAGDTSAAIRAYRDYLVLRSHPEPVLVPQRDSVRSELEVLLEGPVPREGS